MQFLDKRHFPKVKTESVCHSENRLTVPKVQKLAPFHKRFNQLEELIISETRPVPFFFNEAQADKILNTIHDN